MSRKTKIVNISLSPEVYNLADKLVKKRGLSRSELFRRALVQYLVSEERWAKIRRWGAKTAKEKRISDEQELYELLNGLRE